MSPKSVAAKGAIKSSYDKLLLFAVLSALLGSATFLLLKIGQVKSDIEQGSYLISAKAPTMAEPVDTAIYDETIKAFENPFQAEIGDEPLFSLPPPPAPDLGAMDSDGDGMDDQYEIDNGLDAYNAGDASADPDSDGFTNIEEFRSETSPSDPNESPPLPAKLRLVRVVTKPFKLRFQGVQELGDGERFLLNLRSLERSFFVKMNEEVGGFKVIAHEPKFREGQLSKIDVSTLTLQKGDKTVTLVKGQDVTRYEKIALMIFLIDGAKHQVRVGEELKLRDKTYKVIDIRLDGVLIRDITSGRDSLIGRLSAAERRMLQRNAGEVDRPKQSRYHSPTS